MGRATKSARGVPLAEQALNRAPVVRRLNLNVVNVQRKRRFFLVLPSFVLFALVTILTRNVHDSFLLEESFKETVLHEAPNGGPEFEEVKTLSDIWEWLDKTFVPFFYEENLYDGTPLPEFARETVLGVNRIVTGFRVIQRRVREGTCSPSPRFEEFVPMCWGKLNDDNLDTETFVPMGHPEAQGFEFADEGHGVRGYFVDFDLDRARTVAKLEELKRDRFIDLGTREIDIDFTLYNHNINQFLVGRVLFTISATTLVQPRANLHSLRLEPYETSVDKFRLAVEIIFLVLTAGAALWEIWRVVRRVMKRQPVVSWWFGWPMIRMFNIILSFLSLGLWYRYVNDELRRNLELPPPNSEFIDLEKLAIELQEYLLVSAINIFAFILVTLEAVRFSDKASFITEVFMRASEKLISFLILFIFVYCSFALSGHMLFGVSLRRFSTFGRSFTTLFEITTGEQGYEELQDANKAAPVFYYLFIVLVFFLLFNVFVAILADGYIELSEEKRQHHIESNKYTVFDFVREYYLNVRGREPVFDSAAARDLLRDASFKNYDEVAYPHIVRVARARGYSAALVNQLFRRYGHGQVDLIKQARMRAAGRPESMHALVRAEFEAALEAGIEKFDAAEIKKLKNRVVKRIDGEGLDDDSTNVSRDRGIDLDSFESDGSSYSDEY
jgi:hypothetical protein